jgi:hypothetical protein
MPNLINIIEIIMIWVLYGKVASLRSMVFALREDIGDLESTITMLPEEVVEKLIG